MKMHLYKNRKQNTISMLYMHLIHLYLAKTTPHSSLLHFQNLLSDSLTCLSDWKSLAFPPFQVFFSFCFHFFRCSILLRGCLLEVEKFFSSPKFCRLHFFSWQDEYRRDKAEKKERLLTRLLKAQELVLSFSFCKFYPLPAAKKPHNQMQTKKSAF